MTESCNDVPHEANCTGAHRRLGRIKDDALLFEIELPYLAHQDASVPLPLEDPAQRNRNLVRREGASRGLVQERLEEVEVPPIDECHVDGA